MALAARWRAPMPVPWTRSRPALWEEQKDARERGSDLGEAGAAIGVTGAARKSKGPEIAK